MKQIAALPTNFREISVSGANWSDGAGILFVGTGGDLKVQGMAGDVVTFKNVADGVFMPLMIKTVYASGSGTTATDLIMCDSFAKS